MAGEFVYGEIQSQTILVEIEAAVRAACLLEVSARKPGNVHPFAAFDDSDWSTFAASADSISPILAGVATRPLGESILLAVEATNKRVGRNTNLGMILLLAPLAAAIADLSMRLSLQRREDGESPDPVRSLHAFDWPASLLHVLNATTVDDSSLVYKAIRLARPGGLGATDREDVDAIPSVTLVEAMRLAADRDDVAKQYANNFADVFAIAGRFDATSWPELERQIITAHVERIATHSDTLIARKCGAEIAAEASRRAAIAVEAGMFDTGAGRDLLRSLDTWLRADGNRRNPGTTADLIAAALFVAIFEGRLPRFDGIEIQTFAEGAPEEDAG